LALSRYVHLNPVRVGGLGLGKRERQRSRAGAGRVPDAALVQKRLTRLRNYRWSSYPAYAGRRAAPEWLERERILSLGGGQKQEAARCYRQYVEAVVREGLEESPWERLTEKAVLGSREFLAKVRAHVRGDAQEQRGARRLATPRPGLAEIVAGVEKVKGERWSEFRDRYGDSGRDLVLYMGRRLGGAKLSELARFAELSSYSAASAAIRRHAQRLVRDQEAQRQLQAACKMLNVEM